MKSFPQMIQEVKDSFDMDDNIVLSNIEDDIELTSTAVRAHATGTYLIYNKKRYKVIQPISIGGTLTVGTNIELADDISSQVESVQKQADYNTNNGVKNLVISSKKPFSQSGIDYDPNDNGSYYVHGTNSSASIAAAFIMNEDFPVLLKANTTYILSGGVSSNLGLRLFVDSTNYYYDASGNQVICNGTPVTFTNGNSDAYVYVRIRIAGGATVDDTVYPMIREAIIEDGTYQSGAESNSALTQKTTGLIDNTTQLGCVNQLSLDLATIKSLNTSGSWSGNVYTLNEVSFTVNDNGTVTVNASSAPSSNRRLAIMPASDIEALRQKLGGTMRVTGCPSGGADNTYNIYTHYKNTSEYPGDVGEGMNYGKEIDQPLQIQVMSGYAISNKLFKPMISLPSMNLTYDDYVPYAKSNRELTEDVTTETVSDNVTSAVGTLSSKTAFKVGNIINVQCQLSLTTDVAAWGKILTVDVGGTCAPGLYRAFAAYNYTDSAFIPLQYGYDNNGNIKVETIKALLNGKQIRLGFTAVLV